MQTFNFPTLPTGDSIIAMVPRTAYASTFVVLVEGYAGRGMRWSVGNLSTEDEQIPDPRHFGRFEDALAEFHTQVAAIPR